MKMVYNLILDPSQIMDKPDYYLEPTIQALVDVFGFDGNEHARADPGTSKTGVSAL